MSRQPIRAHFTGVRINDHLTISVIHTHPRPPLNGHNIRICLFLPPQTVTFGIQALVSLVDEWFTVQKPLYGKIKGQIRNILQAFSVNHHVEHISIPDIT